MADISAEIAAFQNAVYGEDVRSAMISLANKLNNESSAAATTVAGYDTRLSAIEADGYVTTAKLANGSVTDAKLVQSGGLKDAFDGYTSSALNVAGSYIEQTFETVKDSYVFAQSGSQYNGQVNTSNNYGYTVIPVKFNDLIKVSGRATSNSPICVFLNSSTPSRASYVGVYEFVSTGTTYSEELVSIPYGVTHVAVNTNNTTTFPISIYKYVATNTVKQLWQAGYLNMDDRINMMSVDGNFVDLSPSVITGKCVYSSNTSFPQGSGDVINYTNGAYAIIEVMPMDVIRVNGQAATTVQNVVWLRGGIPSRETFVGAAEYVSGNTYYNKKSWSVPTGVTHAVINTINYNSYPIVVELFTPSKYAANLYQGYEIQLFTEPLHILNDNTGMLDLFLTVGCIGDSLASGESASNDGGTVVYHDLYPYSWGQFLARKTGNTYYNWSKGGLTTKTWLESAYATECYDGNHNCTAYIIGLGENDRNTGMTIGTSTDIDMSDYSQNANTFYGNYGKIIQKIQEIVPKAKIFILTDFALSMETGGYNTAVRTIATLFDNVYLLDLYTYGQDVYRKLQKVIRSGHYGAYGYKVAAMAIATYINWIIENNVQDFAQVEFIDTEWSWTD